MHAVKGNTPVQSVSWISMLLRCFVCNVLLSTPSPRAHGANVVPLLSIGVPALFGQLPATACWLCLNSQQLAKWCLRQNLPVLLFHGGLCTQQHASSSRTRPTNDLALCWPPPLPPHTPCTASALAGMSLAANSAADDPCPTCCTAASRPCPAQRNAPE
jgi:hypothetical protein